MSGDKTIDFWNAEAEKRGSSPTVGYLSGDWPVAVGEARFAKEFDWVRKNVLPLVGNKDVCIDIGCGGGSWMIALAPSFNRVLGTDISQSMVNIANKATAEKSISHAEAKVGSFELLKGMPKADFAFIGGVLMCMTDDAAPKAIRSVFDSLVPGGLALFRESTYYKETHYRTRPLVPGLFSKHAGPRPPYRVTYRPESMYRQWFSDAGLALLAEELNAAYVESDIAEEVLRGINTLSFGSLGARPDAADRVARLLHEYRGITLSPLSIAHRFMPRRFRKRSNTWFLVQRPLEL